VGGGVQASYKRQEEEEKRGTLICCCCLDMEHVGPAEKSFVPFLFFFSFSYRRVSPSSYLIFWVVVMLLLLLLLGIFSGVLLFRCILSISALFILYKRRYLSV
jgi:hypothetical protein